MLKNIVLFKNRKNLSSFVDDISNLTPHFRESAIKIIEGVLFLKGKEFEEYVNKGITRIFLLEKIFYLAEGLEKEDKEFYREKYLDLYSELKENK